MSDLFTLPETKGSLKLPCCVYHALSRVVQSSWFEWLASSMLDYTGSYWIWGWGFGVRAKGDIFWICVTKYWGEIPNYLLTHYLLTLTVVEGRGQFQCGHKRCTSKTGLQSFEVDFKYHEAGKDKRQLVKVRLCEDCAYKLHYRRLKAERRRRRKGKKSKHAEPDVSWVVMRTTGHLIAIWQIL